MDKKSIRNIIGLFTCIVILGCLSTFITKSIIGNRRNNLYISSDNNSEQTSSMREDVSTSDNLEEPSSVRGPINNGISKEKYYNELQLIEKQIEEVWENVTESNSALSAAKYEKGVWDEQLNRIYELYFDEQSLSSKEQLRQEHNYFKTERERLAITAAKNASEALDGLSYNREYVRLTKEKTYDYAERYFLED
ncbi:MAG: DUF1311 domain-containing protein [Lachnospiraceae bacterium]|nr:DUF1311 domain-containing protein [Lachnospiraceae bacterium]